MQLQLPGGQHAAAISLSGGDVAFSPAVLLHVGQAGDIKVDTLGGETGVTVPAVPVGLFAVWVKKVYQSGTSADKLAAVW